MRFQAFFAAQNLMSKVVMYRESLFAKGSHYLLANNDWGSHYLPANNDWGVIILGESLFAVTPA